MNTPHVRWKMIGVVAAVLVVIAAAIFLIFAFAAPAELPQSALNASTTVTTVTNGTTGTVTAPSSPTPAQPTGGAPGTPAASANAITIHLLTPISGNVWTIGQANPIAWDNAADVTGEIDLVNAVTKQFIGVILAQTGVKQTSYTWNAEQVYLGRYSANEIAVVPGTYSIRIHFDGNGLNEDLVSGPITITK